MSLAFKMTSNSDTKPKVICLGDESCSKTEPSTLLCRGPVSCVLIVATLDTCCYSKNLLTSKYRQKTARSRVRVRLSQMPWTFRPITTDEAVEFLSASSAGLATQRFLTANTSGPRCWRPGSKSLGPAAEAILCFRRPYPT
jgi:hypothetical protein